MSCASNLNWLHVIADIHAYNKLNEFKTKDMFKARIWIDLEIQFKYQITKNFDR